MENPEEILQLLERFTKLKQKDIPRELDEYLSFVARTGDTVYRWAVVKQLFREKLVNVITDFHDNTPSATDLPQYPNVDPFNYERMKRILLERLDAFNSAPFTVQRICELLTEPRKQYTRIDKFMRAVEKNILVVSTQEPGRRRSDSENGDSLDSIVNGDLEVNVDIEMDNDTFVGIDSHDLAPEPTITNDSVVASTSKECQENVEPVNKIELNDRDDPEELKEDLNHVDEMPEVETKLVVLEETIVSEEKKDSDEKITDEPLKEDTTEKEITEKHENELLHSIIDTAKITTVDVLHAVVENITDHDNNVSLDEHIETTPKTEEVIKESDTPDVMAVSKIDDKEEITEKEEEQLLETDTKIEEKEDIDITDHNNELLNEPLPKMAKIENNLEEDIDINLKDSINKVEPLNDKEDVPDMIEDESPVEKIAEEIVPLQKLESEITADSNSNSSLSDSLCDSNSGEKPTETIEPEESKEQNGLSHTDDSNIEAQTTAETVPIEPIDNSVELNIPKEAQIPAVDATEPSATTDIVETVVIPAATVETPGKEEEEEAQIEDSKPVDVVAEVLPAATGELLLPASDIVEMETNNPAALNVENVMATDDDDSQTAVLNPITENMPMAADNNDAPKTEDNAMDVDESSGEPMDQ